VLEAIQRLAAASDNSTERCVKGLKATSRGPDMVERGLMLATALVPSIGYDAAADVAKEAAKTNRTIREVAREKTQLSDAELDGLLDPGKMTEPGLGGGPASG
jgi:fumarate hydratase class II